MFRAPPGGHNRVMLHEPLETIAKGLALLAALIAILGWLGALA